MRAFVQRDLQLGFARGADRSWQTNHEPSHGAAEDNRLRRKASEPSEHASSPVRSDNNRLSERASALHGTAPASKFLTVRNFASHTTIRCCRTHQLLNAD